MFYRGVSSANKQKRRYKDLHNHGDRSSERFHGAFSPFKYIVREFVHVIKYVIDLYMQ